MHLKVVLSFYIHSCLLPPVLGQAFVGSNSSEAAIPLLLPNPEGLSSECSSTFTTNVTCGTVLPLIFFSGHFPSSDELTSLCTVDCLQSLDVLLGVQQESCASDVFIASGAVYPATFTTETLLWTYNYTCRRDPISDAFCAPIFDDWANGNAPDQSCSDCVLGTYHATDYPVTSPPPNTISQTAIPTPSTTAPVPTKSCASTYTVLESDDCHSISNEQRVSTSNLLYLNGLEAGCTDFPGAGTELCMPHTCEIYTVKQNDTCFGIVGSYDRAFTISQLVSWNIDINRGCDNLELLVGNQICVSFPGDIPTVTATAAPPTDTEAPVPTNIVDGTNTHCSKYYTVRAGDICASLSQNQGISLEDLYFLNPQINSTSCNNLLLGYSYCVQPVGDIKTYPGYAGQPTNPCVGGTKIAPSSCYEATYTTADPWTFPVINSSTTPTGDWTSIPITSRPFTSATPPVLNPTPTPFQSDMVSGCADFYFVREGDSCYDIAAQWGIALGDLYAWNPSLNGDCSGLIAGVFICMRIQDDTTSTSSATEAPPLTTTQPGNTPPPGPTQAGVPSDCNKWVVQQDGVFCYDMAAGAGISLNCLYELNPALNAGGVECGGLWVGYAYCVGTVSGQCT